MQRDADGAPQGPGKAATGAGPRLWRKFKADWREYCTIPLAAAAVGWFTNWLAVKMIFHPLNFRGIPLRVIEDQPLGLLGWRGIVPAKAAKMSGSMVDMVTTKLVDVNEVFRGLDPKHIAKLLSPELDKLVPEVAREMLGSTSSAVGGGVWRVFSVLSFGIFGQAKSLVQHNFVADLVRSMQVRLTDVLDVRASVITTMCEDRRLLVELFQTCGRNELSFLINSGLWVGFLLGLIQMVCWLLYRNPWTLTLGGCMVGYLTNWIALKWIFEPVNAMKIGPFVLQGLFLRRQYEVSGEFSDFFATQVLTSKNLWHSIFTGPQNGAFRETVEQHVRGLLRNTGVGLAASAATIRSITENILEKLPDHVHVLHDYIDKTLDLKVQMGVAMNKMTPEQFERVLHPIFEEDELTLILAGAALGGAAGFIQQLLAQRAEARKKSEAENVEGGALGSPSPSEKRGDLDRGSGDNGDDPGPAPPSGRGGLRPLLARMPGRRIAMEAFRSKQRPPQQPWRKRMKSLVRLGLLFLR